MTSSLENFLNDEHPEEEESPVKVNKKVKIQVVQEPKKKDPPKVDLLSFLNNMEDSD